MEKRVELRLCLFTAGRSAGFELSGLSAVVGGGRDVECECDDLEVVDLLRTGLGGFEMTVVSGREA